jgi:hypothetical protein
VIALKTGSTAGELSLVVRVKELLADLDTALENPLGFQKARGWMSPRRRRMARRDLDEIEGRLSRLRSLFPELEGVEAGPLVGRARALLASGSIGIGARGIPE